MYTNFEIINQLNEVILMLEYGKIRKKFTKR